MNTADLQYLISSSWRIFFICMTSACHMLWISKKYLPLKHPPYFYALFWIVRTVVLYIGIQTILAYFYEDRDWFMTVYNCTVILFVIIMYFLLYYTFEGEILKIILSSCLAEITAVFPFSLALAAVNYLEGNPGLDFIGEFHLLDFLFPVLIFPITNLLGIIIFPYISRFRSWKIKHRKLVWAIVLIYSFVAFGSILFDVRNIFWGCILILSIYSVCAIGLIIVLRHNQRVILTDKSYYQTRQRLVESYLPDILTQLEQMEHCRKIIDMQMEEITHLESTQANDQKIRSYLSEIQQVYEHIKTGIYCDNWLVDSALCYEQKIMEKEGILFSCNLQDFQNNSIPDEDIVPLLLLLMDWGIENIRKLPNEKNRCIRLQIHSVKNHLLIQLETSGKKVLKLRKNSIRQYLKKYSGNVRQEQMSGYHKTTIDLQYIIN